jgi:hypothetical protein
MLRVIVILLLALLPATAHAEKRIALLIGNKDYKPGVGALVNPALRRQVRSGHAGQSVRYRQIPVLQSLFFGVPGFALARADPF